MKQSETKDEKFLSKINLAALAELQWKTDVESVSGPDNVSVIVNYAPIVDFLGNYTRTDDSVSISFIRPESIPDLETIEELVKYRIETGEKSGFIGRDDFNVVDIKYHCRDKLERTIEIIRASDRPY